MDQTTRSGLVWSGRPVKEQIAGRVEAEFDVKVRGKTINWKQFCVRSRNWPIARSRMEPVEFLPPFAATCITWCRKSSGFT